MLAWRVFQLCRTTLCSVNDGIEKVPGASSICRHDTLLSRSSFQRHPHKAPDESCSCGYYSLRSKEKAVGYCYRQSILAQVENQGKVIEGEYGYRSEFQEVVAIIWPRVEGHLLALAEGRWWSGREDKLASTKKRLEKIKTQYNAQLVIEDLSHFPHRKWVERTGKEKTGPEAWVDRLGKFASLLSPSGYENSVQLSDRQKDNLKKACPWIEWDFETKATTEGGWVGNYQKIPGTVSFFNGVYAIFTTSNRNGGSSPRIAFFKDGKRLLSGIIALQSSSCPEFLPESIKQELFKILQKFEKA